jgi:hypothetical protein
MVAETLTAARAKRTFPRAAGSFGNLFVAWGTIEIGAAVEDGDIFEMVRLPPGATVVNGWIFADDLDTGTEALDMDIGWAGNGIDTADPDGFGNLGVWTGDATTDVKPEVWNRFFFGGVLKDGPKTFGNAETVIQVEANAPANAGHVGSLSVVLLYTVLQP